MANAMLEITNKVWLRGFLSAQKLRRVSERITTIAAWIDPEFIEVYISSYGGDAKAVADFVEAMEVILKITKIKFHVTVEKAGPEGECIALALSQKS
jgi:hypothetical protein